DAKWRGPLGLKFLGKHALLNTKEKTLPLVLEGLKRLFNHVKLAVEKKSIPIVIGGDHASAIGTWSGAVSALHAEQNFGLIWLDAHMDAHTFATSPSGNIHGMPLAALLGKADKKLAAMYPGSGFIKPENLILIGVRSYEHQEYDLLKQAGVEIVFARQIDRLAPVLIKAIDKLSLSCKLIGISIDLDFIDPGDAARR
ncbi:MAG: arginase family protein, partial [Methylobacter sp.]